MKNPWFKMAVYAMIAGCSTAVTGLQTMPDTANKRQWVLLALGIVTSVLTAVRAFGSNPNPTNGNGGGSVTNGGTK